MQKTKLLGGDWRAVKYQLVGSEGEAEVCARKMCSSPPGGCIAKSNAKGKDAVGPLGVTALYKATTTLLEH